MQAMFDLLLDRQAEVDAITMHARDAIRGRGSVVLVEGPAGIGKTALIRATRLIALELGLSALTARGAEIERDFGFGVVRQLFEAPIDQDEAFEEAFTGRAQLAAGLLGVDLPGRSAPVPSGPDAGYVILNSLYWLTVNVARRSPLVVLVDDLHWADPASLRFLSYLARRLEALPLMLMVASRPAAEPGGASERPVLFDDDVTVLRPVALGERAARQVVRAAVPDATDGVCDACFAASGGNPFFLRALAEALRDAGPTKPAEVINLVPHGVAAAVRARIDRLPSPAWKLAHAVAVLGDGAAFRHAARAAGLDHAEAGTGVDALTAAGMFASERPLRFVHPLIRSAVYQHLPLSERSRAHERAALLLAAEDVSPERVAAHLLASEPRGQASACEHLRAAAREARRRGAPEAAVTYLRRALQEPPPEKMRPEVMLELGEAEAMTLDPGPAADHLARGIEAIQDPERRLHGALLLSGILGIDGRSLEGVQVLERALAESQDADPALLARIEGHLVNVARFDLATRQRSLATAGRIRDGVRAGLFDGGVELCAAAAEEAMAGDSAALTAELTKRALTALVSQNTPTTDYNVYTASRCLLVADQFEFGMQVLDTVVEQAREHGAVVSEAVALAFRSEIHYRLGALQSAQADAEASLQTTRTGWRVGLPSTASILAKVLVERGDLRAADSSVTEGGVTGPPTSVGSSYPLTMLLHSRGGLRLAQGEPAAALEDLLEVGRRQEIMGEPNPALLDWRSLAARALTELGRRDEALAFAEDEVRLARRFGAPRALGTALTAAGAIQGGDTGLDRLREAEAVLQASPARLAYAHSLWKLGSALRHRGDRDGAREALGSAVDIAHACGATALEAHALRELRSTGARPRRLATRGPAALTPSERQTAELAAQGLSNREIADALFVTVRTTEFHLNGAFKKLEIRSRQQLTHALMGESDRRHPAMSADVTPPETRN